MSRMLSLPNDSYMLYPVKPVYGSIHDRFSRQDSTLPGDKTKPVLAVYDTRKERENMTKAVVLSGSSLSLGTQSCEDNAVMQVPGTASQTSLASIPALHPLNRRARSSNGFRALKRQVPQ